MSAHEPRCQPTQCGQECEDCFRDASPSQAKSDQRRAAALRQEAQRVEDADRREEASKLQREGFRYVYQCCLCLDVLFSEADRETHQSSCRARSPETSPF